MGAALLALVLILILFGAGGAVFHLLWYVLIAALFIWAIGFLLSSAEGRWYRW
jgi:hypothetical protein